MADKSRTLASLLEPGFASGYEQFKEYVQYAEGHPGLSPSEKTFVRLYELISVAMIEGMNRVEEEFELPPVESMVHLWRAAGTAMATVTLQAFMLEGKQAVRHRMLKCFKEGYDRRSIAFVNSVPDDSEFAHG